MTRKLEGKVAVINGGSAGIGLAAAKRFAEYRALNHAPTAGAYRMSFRYYDERKLLASMFFYTTCFALFLGIFIIRYHLELILAVPLIAGFVTFGGGNMGR